MQSFHCIGLMSGTSLDGLDIAYCEFVYDLNSKAPLFSIPYAETVSYPYSLKNQLKNAQNLSAYEFLLLDRQYGKFIADQVNLFIDSRSLRNGIDFISSHGHTIFHQPNQNLTVQIGNLATIAGIVKKPVVGDFRSLDVALLGQGAPLVPIGDQILFAEYDFCLNLGGIGNISYQDNEQICRIAFDICPANMVFNWLSEKLGEEFDRDGELGKGGQINKELLEILSRNGFYTKNQPKSLGREWIEENCLQILESYSKVDKIANLLRTFQEFVAQEIYNACKRAKKTTKQHPLKLFCTGGGALNKFLIERIKHHFVGFSIDIIVPEKTIVEFKEALVFGFLGLLRWKNEINVLSSVTGSSNDHIGGCIYLT